MKDFSKVAFLVVGPVSTGTRIITKLFVTAGCAGEYGHEQAFTVGPLPNTGPIVWRGHSDGAGFSLNHMIRKVKAYGYTPYVIVTQRDFMCSRESMTGPHADAKTTGKFRTPEECVLQAYESIWSTISSTGVQFCIVSHDALAGWPVAACKMLSAHIGLKFDPSILLREANNKYYTKALSE